MRPPRSRRPGGKAPYLRGGIPASPGVAACSEDPPICNKHRLPP
ncbi:Uncharacterised protein [Bordetella pertussis]|nr:Uncharacterised protein [Bordetella pertussis]CFW32703.1 Uncharacterised protein [Bordetella pertussis]